MSIDLQVASQRIVSVNPATGARLGEIEIAGESDVLAAVARARQAQAAWQESGVRVRLDILRKFQRLVHQQKTEIARQITLESGKPLAEALTTEVLVVLDAAQFLIENAYSLLRDEPVRHGNLATKTKSGKIVREPHGVIGIISPWNYPFAIPATESIAALVAGNSIVLKPSELTTLSALRLSDLLHAAGVPTDVFQVLPGFGQTGAALLQSAIDKLVFTGSVATGKRIAQEAASRLLPVVLEVGGKDPMLVLDDADVDIASSGAVWGAFVNAGQACLSVERCYVARKLHDALLDACVQKTSQLCVGNGLDPNTDVGPLINEKQLRTVEAHVEDAISRGARLLCGGQRLTELGPNFYVPTILADVTHEMRIMKEETFGPVLPIKAFDSDDEAIALANDSEFGLATSVWTKDRARGERLARRVRAGTVMINDVLSCYGISEAPHGGVRGSGIGRTHGKYGLEEMVRMKYLDEERLPGVKRLWWYGYGEEFSHQMQGFVDALFAGKIRDRVSGALRAMPSLTRKRL
jgi:acyl-CoA reductase-like NAD-dependent aldehyde dehydrogenase